MTTREPSEEVNEKVEEVMEVMMNKYESLHEDFPESIKQFRQAMLDSIYFGMELERERMKIMATEMYQCLQDVVGQYGGDFISTSERAEHLVEKYKDELLPDNA